MPIGEIFLAAFIQVLFEKLASTVPLKFARREQVHTLFKKWSGELVEIQAFLDDAEEKQIENKAVKMWLEDLTDLAYDLDDILDEFATEALRHKLIAESQVASTSKSKLRAMIPTCCKGFNPTTLFSDFTRSSTSKVDEITNRLQSIFERGSRLGLQKIFAGEAAKAWHRPPPTSSVIHEHCIYGRDKEKKDIIDFLLRDESNDSKVGVLPIVGMGGLGKTTLAQMVYNDEVVDKNFDLRAWVCVSDEFDIFKISKVILESITSKSCEFKELNEVQVQLKKNLVGKKILIVLDDVWDKKYNDWNVLKSPFNDGAPGSKIIVTTRDEDVASSMGTVQNHLLQHLSEDDCWSVFAQHAFGNRSMDANPNLVFIGRKIVEKCKGLPLAARTLGGLLRCKKRDDEWENVLNSEIWDLTEQGSEILPALRLSYHHLPSHLKQCFAYCSILPKDYEFEEEELVFLWLAEGLLQQQNGKKQMEDLGVEYFRELQSRSFFQPSSGGESSKFVMHDLINDLAQSVAGYTCFRLEDKLKAQEQCPKWKSARHSSYMQSKFDAIKKFETFYEAENVRTFLPLSLSEDGYCFLTSKVPLELLPKMKRLRVLSLNRYEIGELIPKSIGDLKHLRYLNFSYTNIKTVPESLGTLYNLQTLMLRHCLELKKLPADMGNLINLRHLNMIGSNSLEEMPRGIGKLTSLQTLSNFIVMKDNGFRIRELGNLIHLGGTLRISGIENVVDPLDARGVCLNDKQGIDVLTMVWSSESLDGLRNEMVKEVLDILKPHEKLKELHIRGYHGMSFPTWIGDPLFSNMVCMKLQNCKNCKSLPPLGQLPSLKDLHIEGMSGVKHVRCEFYGQQCAKPFPVLETLCFENMSEWEDWYIFGIDEEVQTFTRVSKLSIKECPKLVEMLPSNLPCLKTLEIINCPQLLVEASSLVLPSLTSLSMSDVRLPSLPVLLETCTVLEPSSLTCLNIRNVSIPESLCNPSIDDEVMLANAMSKHLSSVTSLSIEIIQKLALLPKWLTQGLKGLKELKISSCKELTTLWQNEAGLQHSLLALQSLEIDGCPQLVSLFEEDEDVENEGQHQQEGVPSMVRLEHLQIWHCEKLEKLPRGLYSFTSLRNMTISGCPSLVSFSETDFPPSLRGLCINECKALRSLPGWTAHDSNLESLQIEGCDNLESLREEWVHHPPTKLSLLSIRNCKKLESIPSLCNNSLLASLGSLVIESWPAGGGIVSSYILEKGNFLTNLTVLLIANMKIGKPLSEWGLHRFSSLKTLWLQGPSNVSEEEEEKEEEEEEEEEEEYYSVSSFPVDGMLLPTSLTRLGICNFPNLEKISSSMETIQNLTDLGFINCPRLASFPEQGGLPPSLLELYISGCSIMKRRCEKGKGQYWPLIAPIPQVSIDKRYISEGEGEGEGERPI
ncbi:putative disease resistance RPP13-like protein 1 [Camellia lanceoleosa]|uniref:Disease resistance RPP13-like protein 1 n=1 Tax=Camellia lanceoleosa TaxID=1840588 RepID=A0ACC0IN16_9ERIC|nr:putative disease resistance RPP13-like protein 1 [Camellia lanceoleosa]